MVLTKELLLICTSTTLEHLFFIRQKIMTFKRGRLVPKMMLVLITFKCWARKHGIDYDVEEILE